jgi:hypothetical protein
MKKKLVACGDSFTYGLRIDVSHTPYKSYAEIVSEKLDYEFTNLATPAVSNYAIAKQVEHAISLKADLVTIGLTLPSRFDYVYNGTLLNTPTFSDFNSDVNKLENNKIHSRGIYWWATLADRDVGDFKSVCTTVRDYLTHIDLKLKADQDKLIILGACMQLEQHAIPYVILDFGNVWTTTPNIKSISCYWETMAKDYPVEGDPRHFNQLGHQYLSDQVLGCVQQL